MAFVIIPIFAFANAGVPIHIDAFFDPTTVATIIGLVLGKPIGVVLGSAICVYLGFGKIPRGVTWRTLISSSILTGIGFTMSLFIADLALEGPALDAAKVGVLTASAACAAIGMGLILLQHPRDGTNQTPP